MKNKSDIKIVCQRIIRMKITIDQFYFTNTSYAQVFRHFCSVISVFIISFINCTVIYNLKWSELFDHLMRHNFDRSKCQFVYGIHVHCAQNPFQRLGFRSLPSIPCTNKWIDRMLRKNMHCQLPALFSLTQIMIFFYCFHTKGRLLFT